MTYHSPPNEYEFIAPSRVHRHAGGGDSDRAVKAELPEILLSVFDTVTANLGQDVRLLRRGHLFETPRLPVTGLWIGGAIGVGRPAARYVKMFMDC
jgi:hypothetical protein